MSQPLNPAETFSVTLDKASAVPMYKQLGEALRGLIEEGALGPNAKLPPIRKLAESLGVNNITVVNAYKYLESKRAAYSVMGSGTYAAELRHADGLAQSPAAEYIHRSMEPPAAQAAGAINFADTATSSGLFPVEQFKRIFGQVMDRDGGAAFDYQDSRGFPPLRESLREYLAGWGVRCSEENIQVISGAQQGLDIIAKILLSPGDCVIVERPTFYGAVAAFASRGARIAEAELTDDGPDMEKLASLVRIHKPKLLYIIPNYQTPTCVSYSLEKKRQILALAYERDLTVIEEDSQSEFYRSRKPVPLKALDYRNKVIYVKSFSKILMPGLRLGFMTLPARISRSAPLAKHNTDISSSGFLQRAFDLYLRSTDFSAHCERMRQEFGRRYDAMLKAADRRLAGFLDYGRPDGGLCLWMGIRQGGAGEAAGSRGPALGAERLAAALLERGVIVTPGSVFYMSGEDAPFFRISFASAGVGEINAGVKAIGEVMMNLMK